MPQFFSKYILNPNGKENYFVIGLKITAIYDGGLKLGELCLVVEVHIGGFGVNRAIQSSFPNIQNLE